MEWMTPEETAEYLKIHIQTVYDYIRKKKIPAVKVGRHYRIPREELDRRLLEQSDIQDNNRRGRKPTLKFPI